MSNRYKGGVISATPPTTTGGESGTASGAWTLEQQMQLQAAGLWPSQPPPLFIENVFSTYLYTGTGAAQTITNGINLSGKGGLVWGKARGGAEGGYSNYLQDTVRGTGQTLLSNNADGNTAVSTYITSFNSNGFTLGTNGTVNNPGSTFASWTFREQAKFFDVVTYTGTGSATTIAHNLGSVPGCIIVKQTNVDGNYWQVYHRSLGNTKRIFLNTTDPAETATSWNNTTPTSTVFSVGTSAAVNASGGTYVAYLFAHDEGGFGLTGTDNVISCGSFTANANTTVNLGWEPQWILFKNADGAFNWAVVDAMRGWTADGNFNVLKPNLSAAESSETGVLKLTSTGFEWVPAVSGNTYIYIAIRRGPMAVPTTGTSVFQPAYGTGGTPGYPSSFTVDGLLNFFLAGSSGNPNLASRLAAPNYNVTSAAVGETNGSPYWKWDFQTGVGSSVFTSSFAGEMFRRAPSFFDVVCFAQTASGNQRNAHNLTVVPELIIAKARNYEDNWYVYNQTTGRNTLAYLNLTNAFGASTNAWGSSNPTATDFGTSNNVLVSGYNYIAYLFATCPGVSKVGSYTGSSSSDVVVDCGFAAGARFVLIKRTDATGDWYVYDSARGINPSNDPYYLTNSDAAQVTGTNYIGPYSTGFYVNTGTPLNATTGATYIFLAIA